MWKTSLFLLPFFFVANVAKDGECVDYKRVEKIINLEHGSISRSQWVPIIICCTGYRNITGECKPVCEPECFGTGRCVAPNKCECDGQWSGNICDDIITDCKDGLWGTDCELACDCNTFKCSSSGECICQSGYTGLKCEIPCSNGTFGENCSQQCNCLYGDCHYVTGNCICEPGYMGTNCSTSCPEGKYGADCSQICICQHKSKCDKINGKCTCEPGYQGELCEKTCPLGTWGMGCSEKCTCEDTWCDTKTGSCYCNPGYAGAQCKDQCPEGNCGEQCTKTCNCANGKCSKIDCTCTCDEGWAGENCTQPVCDFMKHGHDCTKTCACNESNTERCDFLTGKCICKPGWIGDACLEQCPSGSYGPDCSKKCSCNQENTDSCIDGVCKCKPGWVGNKCHNKCEPGFYGADCGSICLYYGLVNYTCDHIRGDICSENYEGKDCDICRCEPNGECDTKTGFCKCNPGYFGDKCLLPCKRKRYGKNCEQRCKCEDCRKTDGYCKCQDGWVGTACSDYCPIKFYDKETEECIDEPILYINIPVHNITMIGISAAAIILVVIIIVIVYIKYKKPRYDGMININAPKIHLRPPSISAQNQYERPEPLYDTIPEFSPPPAYQRLFRSDEVNDRIRDPAYFDGYERPSHIANIEMQEVTPDYISLDRNSIPPQWPSNNNHYYQFRQQRL